MMRLLITTPFSRITHQMVEKITAPTQAGEWCFLPRHTDTAIALKDGLLIAELSSGEERVIGIRGGLFIKAGEFVRVATSKAIESSDLAEIGETIRHQLAHSSERERRTEGALARLEAGLVRKLRLLEKANG